MSSTKTVLMPIEVPNCDYCWELCALHRICGHFDNECVPADGGVFKDYDAEK